MNDPMEARLAAAELVCHLFGWSPSHALGHHATDTEKAAHEAWTIWYELCGRNIERRPTEVKRIKALIPILARWRDTKQTEAIAEIDRQAAEA